MFGGLSTKRIRTTHSVKINSSAMALPFLNIIARHPRLGLVPKRAKDQNDLQVENDANHLPFLGVEVVGRQTACPFGEFVPDDADHQYGSERKNVDVHVPLLNQPTLAYVDCRA